MNERGMGIDRHGNMVNLDAILLVMQCISYSGNRVTMPVVKAGHAANTNRHDPVSRSDRWSDGDILL